VTFSRFADASSHRTPVGFSGDTHATWASLVFQPEFTATAANIGYYWWSHDIGGHMLGTADPERSARWVQLGCFSPVNRLHSTRSAFSSKEPWRYSRDARATMEAYLRLRHRLVPSLYTWARRAHSQGVGPVRPLYHDHPRQPGAYSHRTTFLFGDLLVVPMVHPLDAVTRLGREDAWLPRGTWWDVVTGRRYEVLPEGGRELSFFRPLERLPVLAREGCVLVLAGDLSEAAGSNPVHLALVLVPGAPGTRGEFVLEEDDGSPEPGDDAVTRTTLTASWSAEGVRLSVREQGAQGVVPSRRRLRLEILGVSAPGAARVRLDGRPLDVPTGARQADGTTLGGGLSVDLGVVDATARRRGTTVEVGGLAVRQAPWQEEVLALLEEARIEYAVKDAAWAAVGSGLTGAALLASLRAVGLGEGLLGAVTEVL
jgi:alpha-glucosidase